MLDCSEFVKWEVLPLLNAPKRMARAQLRKTLRNWLCAFQTPLQIACDFPGDIKLLRELLDEQWPDHLSAEPYDLQPLLHIDSYERAMNRYYTPSRPPHHSLADAHAHQRGWVAWKNTADNPSTSPVC